MRTRTIAPILILSLSILLALPSPLLRVDAVTQVGSTSPWSAFGPRADEIIFRVYADEASMLAAFDAGLEDIVDIPTNVDRLNCAANPAATPLGDTTPNGCDQNNANYYVTNPVADLGEFQLDISHHPDAEWMGVEWLCDRNTVDPVNCTPGYAPGLVQIVVNSDSADDGCGPATQFRLVVHLKNYEENLALITDALEVVSATPAAGAGASVSSTTGTYDLGCLSGTPAKYAVSTFLFGTTSNTVASIDVFTSSGAGTPQCLNGFTCDVDFKVNYRSPSTKKLTTAGIEVIRAYQYLVDKPNLRNISVLKGAAACIDIFGSPSQNIMNSIGDPTTACSATNGGVPSAEVSAATIADDCAVLSSATGPAGWSQISPCTSISLYNLSADDIGAAPSCATNSLGSQIPTSTCFPSRGNQGPTTILAEHGYSGLTDLTAACNHFLLAGLTISPAGATCADVAAGNVVSGVTAHLNTNGLQIASYIRLPGVFPARPRYGQIAADELDFLFGTPAPTGGTVCYGSLTPDPGAGATCSVGGNVQYYAIAQVGNIVFTAQNIWNTYTGGQSHGSTPDALFFSYHSLFASNVCGGAFADFPDQYDSYCDPVYDTYNWAGEFSVAAFADSYTFFQKVATLFATRGPIAPMYAQVNNYNALNDWNHEPLGTGRSSLNTVVGGGFEATSGAFYNFLNMQPSGLGVAPYQAGGGVSGLIRRPSSGSGTLHLNILASANTVWENDPLVMIWDSMFATNPNTGGSSLQIVDYLTTTHSSFFDAATGQNIQTFILRNDVCWQHSTTYDVGAIPPCNKPLTADDVCFSIGIERDAPGLGKLAVQDVISCTYPDSRTVVVRHQGRSAFQLINIGGVPIFSAELWGTPCNWAAGPHSFTNVQGQAGSPPAAVVGAPCADQSFDPMAMQYLGAPCPAAVCGVLPANVNGLMVGTGPYMCVVPPGFGALSGKIGGSCALNSLGNALEDQSLTPGNTLRLVKNPFFFKGFHDEQSSNLQAQSWADSNNDGKVTIVDASSLSAVFGLDDAYFDHPVFGSIAGQVDIVEASFLAKYYDAGTIAPCINLQCPGPPLELTNPGPLIGPDTDLDPYVLGTGYYKGVVRTGGDAVAHIKLGAGKTCANYSATLYTPGTSTVVAGPVAFVANGPDKCKATFAGLAAGTYEVQIINTLTATAYQRNKVIVP